MPVTTGIFNTGRFTQDQAKKSFASMIFRLMPGGNAPLLALSSMIPKKTAVQVEHGFFTKTAVFPNFTLTADVAAIDTTFTVADTSTLVPGQVHRLQETGENVIIDEVLSSTSIKVTRSVGSVAAAAITVASNITTAYQVGNAFEEASIRPNSLSIQTARITNLTQIFRDSWALSGSSAATQLIAGDNPVADNRLDGAAFHATALEKAIFFGQKSQGTRNGQPFRTMDGILSMVSDLTNYPSSFSVPNVYTAGATTSYDQLLSMLDPVFNQVTDPMGSNERLLFVGATANNVIHKIGRLTGQYQIVQSDRSFGLQFSTVKLPRGTFKIIEHPLFNTNPYWSKLAVAVDPATFGLAYLTGRDTAHQEFNAKGTPVDNGIDAIGGTFTTEVTVEIRNVPANAVIWNLTDGAA